MRSSLLLGSFTVGLRPVLAGLSALALAGCGSTTGDLAAFNAPGAKPAYFVDEQQIIPDEDSRLATLNGEMLQHFNVVLIVNKAASGEHAQTMMVMRPTSPGCGGCAWEASDIWDVSTGREREEKYFTTTPTGVYQLDQSRFHRDYTTTTWDDAPMPFSMFWRYLEDGGITGFAVHAANDNLIKNLGKRNSGGCIRLHPTNAEALFEELLAEHKGRVPLFDWNQREGEVVRSDDGAMRMTAGLRALLVVENGEDLDYIDAQIPPEELVAGEGSDGGNADESSAEG